MAVRRERVILDLQDNFTSGMARAAAATALLDKQIKNLDGSTAHLERPTRTASKEIDNVSTSSRKADTSINQLTGRLRVLADAAAVIGPSFAPIGAVAVPALTGLASQAGFAALGLGTLVAAAQGVGDALKAVNEASLEPTAANLDKAREAMAKLGPDAREFVSSFQEMRPVFADIRDAAAAGWFPGLTDSLTSLERIAPEVANLFESIGRVGGNLVAEGASAFAGPGWADFRRFVAAEAPRALDELGHTLGNVARGLAEVWQAFGPLNRSFSSWLLDASRSFAEWADGLSATDGFQEFVDYIRENGPRVADALASIGKAVVEIIEAIAPLGGPSLKIIETFADAISAIADSDLGTPILGAVAALALYNRTLQATAALQTRITGSTAIAGGMTSGGIFGATKAGAGGLKNVGAELRTVGANWRYLGTSAAYAEARQSKAIAGMAKGAAVVGGLAVATTGAADGLGLTNTASLALLGTMAGPWGVAVGGAAGLMIDAKSAAAEWADSLRDVDNVISSGSIDDMIAKLAELKKQQADAKDVSGFGDAISDGLGGIGQAFGAAGAFLSGNDWESNASKGKAAIQELESALAREQRTAVSAALAQLGLSDSLVKTAEHAGLASTDLIDLAGATQRASTTAWAAFDAHTQLGEAMAGVATAAKEGKRGIDESTKGGRENREALSQLAGSWATAKAAMEENDAPAKKIERRYNEVRNALIGAATRMGATKKEAERLANQLAKPMSIVIKEKHREAVESAKAAIATLRRIIEGKPIVQTVEIRRKYGPNATVGTPGGLNELLGGRAHGGYTGRGGKYEPAGIVHRDEVVIPKELVRRDAPMLKQRYGHLPGMDQLYTGGLAGYAGGGRVGALDFADLPAISTAASLRELNRALAMSTKALDKERTQREAVISKIQDLRGTVSGNLTSELFGATNPWSSGSSITDALGTIRGDIANGQTLQAQIKQLKSKGLDGNALASLLANADAETIANFAAGPKSQLQQFEAAFNQRAQIAAATGREAGSAAFGAELKQQTRETRRVADRVDRLTRITQAEHRQDRKASKRGAGDGARNRRRG